MYQKLKEVLRKVSTFFLLLFIYYKKHLTIAIWVFLLMPFLSALNDILFSKFVGNVNFLGVTIPLAYFLFVGYIIYDSTSGIIAAIENELSNSEFLKELEFIGRDVYLVIIK